ncbi:hypothetical protein emb_1c0116 [Coriobacteriaceae bacterium EMTCatB1]|nr:hypothetical protein emb_1c0116 [Coriobacteriaceae bacterium EMTCatB1]
MLSGRGAPVRDTVLPACTVLRPRRGPLPRAGPRAARCRRPPHAQPLRLLPRRPGGRQRSHGGDRDMGRRRPRGQLRARGAQPGAHDRHGQTQPRERHVLESDGGILDEDGQRALGCMEGEERGAYRARSCVQACQGHERTRAASPGRDGTSPAIHGRRRRARQGCRRPVRSICLAQHSVVGCRRRRHGNI